MKRFCVVITAALFAFFLGAAAAQTPPMRDIFLPLVSNGQASVCDGKAPIFDHDVGALDAMRDADGKYIVTLQDRSHSGRAIVAEHVGDHLVDLEEPASTDALAGSPAFSPPGPKQGALALVPNATPGEKRRWYYTERERDDTPNEGPYKLWCMEF